MQLRRRKKKKGCCLSKLIGLLVISVALIFAWNKSSSLLPIGTGYAAKYLCSCANLTDRNIETVIKDDLTISPMQYATSGVLDDQSAVSSFFGLFSQQARFDEDNGCVLDFANFDEVDVVLPTFELPNQDTLDWPLGNATVEIDQNTNLELVLNRAFEENAEENKNTRAVLVLKDGELIGERYASGFDRDTRLLGWSMSKTITGVLIGILAKSDPQIINRKGLFDHWKKDGRKQVTIDHLMRMSSGIRWQESYGSETDVTRMLYKQPDMVQYTASLPLDFDPDTEWEYASGTTNLLSGYIRSTFSSDTDYWLFPYQSLFHRIGMQSAVLETDAAGNFVGSSYGWATARDWARFGLFLSNKGIWEGDTIVEPEWLDYMTTPTALAPMGQYGAQTWLNAGELSNEQNRIFPDCPTDLFYCAGFKGQYVIVIPSEDVVIVRLGHSDLWCF